MDMFRTSYFVLYSKVLSLEVKTCTSMIIKKRPQSVSFIERLFLLCPLFVCPLSEVLLFYLCVHYRRFYCFMCVHYWRFHCFICVSIIGGSIVLFVCPLSEVLLFYLCVHYWRLHCFICVSIIGGSIVGQTSRQEEDIVHSTLDKDSGRLGSHPLVVIIQNDDVSWFVPL